MDLKQLLRKYKYWLVMTIILLVFGTFAPEKIVRTLILAAYFAIFAMAWGFFAGYSGYVFFAPHGILGFAAYISVLASYKGFGRGGIPEGFGTVWPIYITIPLGVAAGILIGFLSCLPSLRLRGSYFTLFSLAFIMALDGIIITLPGTGGTRGLFGFPQVVLGTLPNFYLSLALMVSIGIILHSVGESHIGRILKAVRMNEDLVNSSGVNANKYKFIGFTLSLAALAIGGTFFVHYLGSLSPESVFGILIVFRIIIATILGGLGTIVGPLIGAYFVLFLEEGTRTVLPHAPTRTIIIALIGLIVYILMPEGIVGKIEGLLKRKRV